ncbi:MAG: beta-lactamase family protein [bacterium]|nr:MAG: beta-lactamase family protein [bacterium]
MNVHSRMIRAITRYVPPLILVTALIAAPPVPDMAMAVTVRVATDSARPAASVHGVVQSDSVFQAASVRGALQIDSVEFESFCDGVVGAQMEAYRLAGVVISAVHDGSLFFAKGYGHADIDARTPVLPESTLFRSGSVGKLFTWTAVMQLVERGKLDLHADVNDYIDDFEIPATFPDPITLSHLLTHTPGFEERIDGLFAVITGDMTALGTWLAGHLPARIWPPGTVTAYSNYGAGLAGYIVGAVSGMPFERYVEERIFEPLGMEMSTFHQPLPDRLAPHAAVGYSYSDGLFHAQDFELIPPAPAGAMSTTAADMAAFIIAHLQDGRFGETRILSEETSRLMHSRHFANDRRASGMAYGFIELNRDGERLIYHGGDTFYFHSLLLLIPSRNFGLFLSYNSADGGEARVDFMRAILDHYFHIPMPPLLEVSEGFTERVKRLAGTYVNSRSNFESIEKLMNLFRGTVTIEEAPDGTIRLAGAGWDESSRWVEVEPLVFRHVYRNTHLYFREDGRGRITHLLFERSPLVAFIRLPWYGAPSFHRGVLIVCGILFLSAVIAWPVGYLLRGRRTGPAPAKTRQARLLAWLTCAANLFFIAALLHITNRTNMVYGIPVSLKVLLVVPILTSVMAVLLLVYTALSWRGRYWGKAARIHYTLIAAAALSFIWFLNHWNLLGFHF